MGLREKASTLKKLQNHLIGVEQGDQLLFSDFEDHGPMWAGKGARRSRTTVTFSEPFRKPPTVHVALCMIDMDHQTNQRMDLRAESVTATDFEIVLRTWGDTRIARLRANWMAIGEVTHEDDWDVP